ncbi:MAG: hypothetical protein JG776_933 [Caloramator sp.]|jgi:protein required for attachment to host cells|uniref:hypothetical protein n=1 Tax=Caloramator sp. TaxID=1871330 RepID=UPI001D81CE89|nr:hypothetical protein [Caloramator sp.]MBZ4663231.1 hypothetical protein [Caloramator sp.]
MKKTKVLISILLILILSTASLIVLANTKDYEYNNEQSTVLLEKMIEADIKGEELIVDDSEVNGLINKILSYKNQFGSAKVNNFNIKFLEDEIMFIGNVCYNNKNFQLSSTGKLYYQNEYMYYSPRNFKIGKINLPKSFVFSILNKQSKLKEYIDRDAIKIDVNNILGNIESIEIKESKAKIIIKKTQIKLFADSTTKDQTNLPKNENTNIENKQVSNNNTNNKPNVNTNTTNKQSSKSANKYSSEDEYKKVLLKQLNSELNIVSSKLSTSSQKNLLNKIKNVVNKMIANPDYNYNKDKPVILSDYSKLSTEEKNDFKIKVLINTSPSLRTQLLSLFIK